MIDAHCHLDLYQNPEEEAQEIEKKQITTVAVTNLPSHFVFSTPHVRLNKHIHLALGMHPLVPKSYTKLELTKFRQAAKEASFIGEVGLDFSVHGKSTINQQLRTFQEVLQSVNDRPRFISLHSRGAEEKVSELLDQYRIKMAVFHWYSGPISILVKIIENGHYVSVNPAMVKSQYGQKIIDQLPRTRVLTETDGPYVSMGSRMVKPMDVASVLIYLAKAWGISADEAERQVLENFQGILDSIGTPH